MLLWNVYMSKVLTLQKWFCGKSNHIAFIPKRHLVKHRHCVPAKESLQPTLLILYNLVDTVSKKYFTVDISWGKLIMDWLKLYCNVSVNGLVRHMKKESPCSLPQLVETCHFRWGQTTGGTDTSLQSKETLDLTPWRQLSPKLQTNKNISIQ